VPRRDHSHRAITWYAARMRLGVDCRWMVILALMGGCAGATAPPPVASPPAEPPSAATTESTASAAPPPETAEAPASSEPEPEVEASPPEPEPEPAGPSVAEVCEQLCVSADQRCSKKSAYRCRTLCKTYVKKSEGCEEEVKKALTCQATGDDAELCSHVAAVKCARAFQRMQACQRGEKPVERTREGPPAHWQAMRDEELGITVTMPPGARLDPNAKLRTWQAKEGGITYVVSALPTPPKKLSDGVLLRMVVRYVGYRCQRNLKVRGRFTSKGVTGVAYSTACTDGSQRAGMLRIRGGKGVAVGVEAPGETQLSLDPYLFSFAYLNRPQTPSNPY